MHIKNIIVSGFRSYRELSFEEGLSPGHNVLVGRNGSGKSNFFAAVQFVLSDKYADLRPEDRTEFFHAGAHRQTLSVFVEIVFDNADGRLVLPGRAEEGEVRVRRTLGLRQDEFRINDRRYHAGEVRQLLESAGFSAANPYYVVEQGKIAHLARMSGTELYGLLKDVAGTKVYESRRAESETILRETQGRREKIDEAIKEVADRLGELEAEASELQEFNRLEKKRRALEYSLCQAELAQTKEALDRLSSKWEAAVEASRSAVNQLDGEETSLRRCEEQARASAAQASQLEELRKRFDNDRQAILKRRAVAELKLADATAAMIREKNERKALTKDNSDLRSSIAKLTKELEGMMALVASKQQIANDTASSLAEADSELTKLQTVRGRAESFRSKSDRDAWIQQEVERNQQLIQQNNKELQKLKSSAESVQHKIDEEASKAQALEAAGNNIAESTTAHDDTREQAAARREALNTLRREQWSGINHEETLLRRIHGDLERAQGKLDRAIRHDVRQGLTSLREVLAEMNDPGLTRAVHGPVVELIDVDPTYARAAEVTAGGALFHVVVDTFQASRAILAHFNSRRKQGRVTFLPLDTCRPSRGLREATTTAEYSPLIAHVRFDPRHAAVMGEIFGRTVVVASLDVGAAVARDLGTDAITKDGDQFSRKGGVTGGYVDSRTSKMGLFRDVARLKAQQAEAKARHEGLVQAAAQTELELSAMAHKVEHMHSQFAAARDAVYRNRLEMRMEQDQVDRLKQQLADNLSAQEALQKQNDAIKATNDALISEKKSEFLSSFSAAQDKEMAKISLKVDKLRREAALAKSEAMQHDTNVKVLQQRLRESERRLATVTDRLAALSIETSVEVNALKTDVDTLLDDLKSIDGQISSLDQQIESLNNERRQSEEAAEGHRARITQIRKSRQRDDASDSTNSDRAQLIRRREDALAKIRKLGVTPADAEEYAAHSAGKLMFLLKSANESLQKFSHVNRKAADQYSTLADSKGELTRRRHELDEELRSVESLIVHLDGKKEEVITRTYKEVQFQFDAVFKELVSDEGAQAALLLVPSEEADARETFGAVRVEANFGIGNVTELSELSGGQQSLVALALIFAIQRCDPAPFYLLDEIDAALDTQYRTAVAAMIRRQAETCQFITATFKTEMVEAADRVFGIFFTNKASRIRTLTTQEAVALLHSSAEEGKRPRSEAEE